MPLLSLTITCVKTFTNFYDFHLLYGELYHYLNQSYYLPQSSQ
jgi:hypothetical protein